jgi:hypothetical protein
MNQVGNQVINNLKQQAGIDYNPDQEGLDLFAELIVRECAVICDAYGMPDGTSEVAQILSTAIKSKFGLE